MNAANDHIFEPQDPAESVVYSDSAKNFLPFNNYVENDITQTSGIQYYDACEDLLSPDLNSPAFKPSSGILEGVSNFIRTSFTDVPLGEFEEILGRLSINDTYVGPLRLTSPLKVDKSSEEPISIRNDPYLLLPFSKSSIAFIPPGVMVVTELWNFFASERLSLCNHYIFSMNFDQLQQCLHAHSLNQFGSTSIMRRRLQEFVRRLRESPPGMSADDHFSSLSTTAEQDEFLCSSEVLFPPLTGNAIGSQTTSGSTSANSLSMIKLQQPVVLTPDIFYSYLLIIDLEATCDGRPRQIGCPEFPHEIIEFPVLLYDTRQRKCVSVFHSFCKPKLKPILSSFCTTLTNISQTEVDKAVSFPTLLAQLENWMLVQNKLTNQRCAVVCDCNADMAKFMRIQCQLSKISMPSWSRCWINLSKAFRHFYRLPPLHRSTLSAMLDDLELSFAGKQHRGLDDAINILRVVQILLADGCRLRVNERVDPGRPPHYTASVPRALAESACGRMGSKLSGLLEKRSKSSSYCHNQGQKPQLVIPIVTDNDKESLLWLNSVQKKRVGRQHV